MAPRHHGPFQIVRVLSPVAYQLELPTQWSIHPVFHSSLLTPYIETDSHGPNFSRPPPDLITGEAEYEVENIRSHRRHGKRRLLQYLLKWKGYPESDNTWEPADQIHAPELVKAYHRRHPLEQIKATQLRQLSDSRLNWTPHLNHPLHPTYSSSHLFDHHPTPPIASKSSNLTTDPTLRTVTLSNILSSAAN